ncbi:FadR/GntR family transcriptional regulator [Pseudonocardia sp. KRD291]|uniref:FadR/GntR family transcriptional regulator n=1 Tax=Pseudonocardia sp. KRD291 TaxID=2792007 RepID=UPI001C4A692B|nr:FadR/GntR family transcriptional regulator [Pseudonocardia sp. KRD291]MBW0101024.1 FadR family transcriptional regulator [Pseudonocardia sp. KRD291]
MFADELRDRILSESVPAGALLPAERELAEESGLSRAAVREALGMLSMEGLLATKIGRGGGYVVQQPPREGVVRFMDMFIRGRRINTTSLLEVRDLIEPSCAVLAAQRGSDEDIDRLQRLTVEMADLVTDVPLFLDRNVDWHVAVAEASGNDVLAAVMSAISANIRAAIAADEYGSPVTLRKAHRLHEKIIDAIRRRDPETAGQLMQRHLHAASSVLFE